jgi:hypothetical protein
MDDKYSFYECSSTEGICKTLVVDGEKATSHAFKDWNWN